MLFRSLPQQSEQEVEMPKPINRNKTLEDQIWDDIAPRVQWFTIRQVARKLMVSVDWVRIVCEKHHKRNVLDKKILNGMNFYRVKE